MKRLLMVVDYQNDFVDGALGFPGAEKLEKPIADKIAAYREAGDEVAFTFDTHRRDYLDTQEGKNLPVAHCVEGTPGHDLYGQVADAIPTPCSASRRSARPRSSSAVASRSAPPTRWASCRSRA